MSYRRFLFLVTILFFAFGAGNIWAGDLDDGISSFTDDSISKWDNLGKKDRNINFIKLDAKSRAKVRANAGITTGTSSAGSGNMNSVVLGPGGNVRGDIIIIDESKGDKTQVVE